MAVNPLVDIVMASTLIKAQMPQQFQMLCEALRAYEIKAIGEVLAADATHDVFRAQGKVKSVQELRRHIVECVEMRNTFTRRDNHGHPTG